MASLESAVTGAIASSVANIAVYPLDLAKTLVQTQLKEKQNLRSSDNITSQASEEKLRRNGEDENVRATNSVPQYKNALDCIIKIFKERGISGLYNGMSTSILGSFVQSFCYFFWYTMVRKYYLKFKTLRAKRLDQIGKIRFNTIEELILGVIAAATSQLFTSPISIISTRQQTVEGTDESAKLRSVIQRIYQEHNGDIRGFWKGLKVSLVLCINPSITLASYQKLKALLFSAEELIGDKNEELTAAQNFVLGVLSKAISTLITQPLIISKASLQRTGSKFHSFQQVIWYLYQNEGLLALWKGIKPQLAKGVLVQGLLFMFKGELTKFLHRIIFLQSNILFRRRRVTL